jgi:DNA-directed RNA polymerase subunit RPC12/RpoP
MRGIKAKPCNSQRSADIIPFMTKHHTLEFDCRRCKEPVRFSLFEIEHHPDIACSHCWKKYVFDDPSLISQLKQFSALCRQIQASKEILSHTSIGVDMDDRQVKIPFKLLLTRLSSCLDLEIGDTRESLSFRFEPLKEI